MNSYNCECCGKLVEHPFIENAEYCGECGSDEEYCQGKCYGDD